MGKNVIKLVICNNECLLSTDDPESYVRAMGDEVEKAVTEFMDQNQRISVTLAAILAALRFCDEKRHALDDADNLRGQIRDYLEESSRARLSEESAPDPAAAAGHPAKQPSRGAQAHAPSPMQVGNYARPQKEPEEPEGSNFISFFEKKDEE